MKHQSILKKHHQRLTRLEKDTREIKLELIETQESQKAINEDNEKFTVTQEERIERIEKSNEQFQQIKEEQLEVRKELLESNAQFREEIRDHCHRLEPNIGNLIDQKMEVHVNNLKYSMLRWGVGISVGILGLVGRVFGIY